MNMRLDKYLKVSRIIKRRTLAKEYVDNGLVKVNKKVVKAAYEVNVGDYISIQLKDKNLMYKVTLILEHATEEKAKTMYEEIN